MNTTLCSNTFYINLEHNNVKIIANKEKKRKGFQKILEFGIFPISPYTSFPYYPKG